MLQKHRGVGVDYVLQWKPYTSPAVMVENTK